PIHWVDAYGWRRTTENERLALFYFFRAVGERMNIKNIPATLNEFSKFCEEYERKNFVKEETNTAVGNATVNIVKGWIPIGKPLVFPVMKCLLDDSMLQTLGYSSSPRWLKAFVRGAMKVRAFFLRKVTFKKYPS